MRSLAQVHTAKDGRMWVSLPVCLAHKLLCSRPHGSCGPPCPAMGGLCPAGGAVTVHNAEESLMPQSRLPRRLGSFWILLHPLQLLSHPKSGKGLPDAGGPLCQHPHRQSRALGSKCLSACSSGLSKLHRLLEDPSQHSSGTQISRLCHFLAAWPS